MFRMRRQCSVQPVYTDCIKEANVDLLVSIAVPYVVVVFGEMIDVLERVVAVTGLRG